MDRNRLGGNEPQQPPGREVAEQRTRSGCQHTGKAMALQREVGVPHGKYPLMESMETPCLHPSLDGSIGVTEPPKLANRDHAVLLMCQRRQRLSALPRLSF